MLAAQLLAERISLSQLMRQPLHVKLFDDDNGRRMREFFNSTDELLGEVRAHCPQQAHRTVL